MNDTERIELLERIDWAEGALYTVEELLQQIVEMAPPRDWSHKPPLGTRGTNAAFAEGRKLGLWEAANLARQALEAIEAEKAKRPVREVSGMRR